MNRRGKVYGAMSKNIDFSAESAERKFERNLLGFQASSLLVGSKK